MNSVFTINIDSPLITVNSLNYRLPSWPPPDDFPIVVGADGTVISRFKDSTWNLTPYGNQRATINFGDGVQRNNVRKLDKSNARLLRLIMAWWLYGERPIQSASTVVTTASLLRGLFLHCGQAGILVSDLSRFPKVLSSFCKQMAPSSGEHLLFILHTLFEHRDSLQFTVLDREGLRRFESQLPEYERKQTPYIPPRIWLYQVNRLRAFLDDFHLHREKIEACYQYCLDAYAENYGSLSNACSRDRKESRAPFRDTTTQLVDARYFGSFFHTAQRFGIADLLERWCLPSNTKFNTSHKIRILSFYLTQVSYIGTAYLVNFSGMRIEEASLLKSDCLEVENDERLGSIYLLKGETSKTLKDDSALWVTSPTVTSAIDAMKSVSRLRMIPAAANSNVPTTPELVANPPLRVRAYEPWCNTLYEESVLDKRIGIASYSDWARASPNLFDIDQLRITESDIQMARLITPTLSTERFSLGTPWTLTWHQLRRTAAVNMTSSGLVSDRSLQYQLKHLTRAMSLYYGQGYSRRNLNLSMRTEYVRTVYEMLSRQFSILASERFVSPYGESHKRLKMSLFSQDDHEVLIEKAKKGQISYRETLLGGCLKVGPCQFGGIDNVMHCGGNSREKPCADALLDKTRRPSYIELARVISTRLSTSEAGSPEHESLTLQLQSVENSLNAIS